MKKDKITCLRNIISGFLKYYFYISFLIYINACKYIYEKAF